MKTGIHKVSYKRWLIIILFNFFLVFRDVISYSASLDGKQGNLIEFMVFSLNNVYFIVLAGVISVWILTVDFKDILGTDILAMTRFKERKKYFKARMLEEGCRVFLYTFTCFLLRVLVSIVMQYNVSSLWNVMSEYDNCSYITMTYIVIDIFITIFGYLCFFVWTRELIFALTNNEFLRNVLPALLPITELAILKSLNWICLPFLPIGNILLSYPQYSKGLISHCTYWALLLFTIFTIRLEVNLKCDFYE